MRRDQRLEPRPAIIAHRGAAAYLPENTLEAFELAISQGADFLECDLRFTADDEIVIIHDPTIRRVTSQRGVVSELTLAQIKQISGGRPLSRQILTLKELVTKVKGRVGIAVELKDPKFQYPRYSKRLTELLIASSVVEQTVAISFSSLRLRQIRAVCPSIRTGIITYNLMPRNICEANIECALWPILFLNPWFVKLSHKLGKQVWAMDTFPNARVKYYLKRNVQGILTYCPDQTRMQVYNA